VSRWSGNRRLSRLSELKEMRMMEVRPEVGNGWRGRPACGVGRDVHRFQSVGEEEKEV